MKTLRLIVSDTVLVIARIVVGGLLILQGWNRMMGEGGMATQVQYLAERQVPAPEIMAWGATILELGAGLFLVFGLLTPLLGALLAVEQVLIIVWTNWFNGPFGGGADAPGFAANAALACVGLLFLAFGGGRASMDQLFKRSSTVTDDSAGTDDTPDATADSYSSSSSLLGPRD